MKLEFFDKNTFWKKVTVVSLLSAIMILTMHTINNVADKYTHSPITVSILTYIHWVTHNAVKIFWMLSALLFYRNYSKVNMVAKYKSRAKSLIVPYFSWNVISMCLFCIIGVVPLLANQLNTLEPFTFTLNNVVLGLFHHKYNMIFWFIFELIILVGLSPVIYLCLKNKIVGLICIGLFYIFSPYIFVSDTIIRGGMSWIFYLIAAYFGIHWFKYSTLRTTSSISYLCILGVFVLNFLQIRFHDIRLLSDVLTLLSCIFIWIGSNAFLTIFRNWMIGISMFIFAIHFNIDMTVSKLVVKLIPDFAESLSISFLLAWSLTLLLSIAIALLCKKYFGKLYVVLNGGR